MRWWYAPANRDRGCSCPRKAAAKSCTPARQVRGHGASALPLAARRTITSMIEGWAAGRSAGVAGTAQGIVAEAVLRSEDEDLGLEQGVGLVKCTAEVSLGYRR